LFLTQLPYDESWEISLFYTFLTSYVYSFEKILTESNISVERLVSLIHIREYGHWLSWPMSSQSHLAFDRTVSLSPKSTTCLVSIQKFTDHTITGCHIN